MTRDTDATRARPNDAARQKQRHGDAPTPAIVEIAACVFAGHGSLRDVARFTGISHETIRQWLKKGREGDERYTEFARACDEGLTSAKLNALAKVEEKDPKWLLVVRHKMQDPAQKHEITGKGGKPLGSAEEYSDEDLEAELERRGFARKERA